MLPFANLLDSLALSLRPTAEGLLLFSSRRTRTRSPGKKWVLRQRHGDANQY